MIFFLLFSSIMSGDRPDYELDIFSMLVDLVERPAGPICDICILTYISLGVLCLLFIILCLLVALIKRNRIQYSVGVYKQ